MLRRYELTDQEWKQIVSLLPPEKRGRPGRPSKDNRTMLTAMVRIAHSGAPWHELPERYNPWETVYSRFRKRIDDVIPNNIFQNLSLDAELEELSLDAAIVQVQKRGPPNEIRHSRGGDNTKIHAAVDAYGYPAYLMLSEGQRNDINYAIPVLEHIEAAGEIPEYQKEVCWLMKMGIRLFENCSVA